LARITLMPITGPPSQSFIDPLGLRRFRTQPAQTRRLSPVRAPRQPVEPGRGLPANAVRESGPATARHRRGPRYCHHFPHQASCSLLPSPLPHTPEGPTDP